MSDYQLFELGDLELQSKRVLPDAKLAYKTYGSLAADKSNAVLYPTSYGAQHGDIEWLIGPGRILDTDRWFVVIPNQFGNGLSTSPSNSQRAIEAGRWPGITHADNVGAQRRLLRDVFGIERLPLVYGWSMGGQQALHWAVLYPDEVDRICVICSSARTSRHNLVFLEGVKAALTGDPAWRDGWFHEHPVRGLQAMGRVYAGWAMSQAFYRERVYEKLGFPSIEDYLVRNWEANYLRRDGNDLLAMLDTWMKSDVSANDRFNGDLEAALGSIAARAMIMPCRTDLYFTPEDSEAETAMIPGAEYRPIESIRGHRAGNPIDSPDDELFIRQAVQDLTR